MGNNSSFFCAGANLPEICLKSHGRTECAPTKFSGDVIETARTPKGRPYELGMSNI